MQTGEIVLIISAIFGCTGFWTFLEALVIRKLDKKSTEKKALVGLLHDRIYALCNEYIDRGFLTTAEHKNLMALYEPYEGLGGNSTAKQLKETVDTLPIRGN